VWGTGSLSGCVSLSDEKGEHIGQYCGANPGNGKPGLGVQKIAEDNEHRLQDGKYEGE